MEPLLSDKQKANRAHYARRAEKIKAQKRAAYQKAAATQPATLKPARAKINITYCNPDKLADPTHTVKLTTKEERAKLKIRRLIEDWLLARELGIERF